MENLGTNIIIQKDNSNELLSKPNKLLNSSEFIPLNNNEPTYIFTKDDDDKIQNIVDDNNKNTKIQIEIEKPIIENYLTNNIIGRFYFASLTIVGLYVVFRMIQKTK